MGWRILQLTKPCKISVKNKQLLYESDEIATTIPIEDLSVVILETSFVNLTGHVLSNFAEHGVVLFSCDGSHNPNGTFFPFHDHSRYAEIARSQIDASEPLKKRLWQSVVIQKIRNQSAVLRLFGKDNALDAIAGCVASGDSENAEAYAAQLYWKALFAPRPDHDETGGEFSRRNDNLIVNKALNYGYAIIRGCMARSIVGAGLMPCFGIHHDNNLNQFNLVDDLMEPLRPFADYMVATMDFAGAKDLTPQLKQKIVSVLLYNCNLSDEKVPLLKACEMSAESLAHSFREKNLHALKLPELNGQPQTSGENE